MLLKIESNNVKMRSLCLIDALEVLKATAKEGGCLLVAKRCHKEVAFGRLILWGLTVASVCEPIKCLSGESAGRSRWRSAYAAGLWPGTLMNSSENWPIFAVTQHLPRLILWAFSSKGGKRCVTKCADADLKMTPVTFRKFSLKGTIASTGLLLIKSTFMFIFIP